MKVLFGLVFFATGWGPTKGGINSFNFDLCCALGKQSNKRSAKIFCICPGVTTEREKKEATNSNVTLIDINIDDFNNYNFDQIILEKIAPVCEKIFWIGHDVITSKHAFACRDYCKNQLNSKVVVFHHMNYSEYYAIGEPSRTETCEEKVADQESTFRKADYAIAVGPKLLKSLEDILIKSGTKIPHSHIIPGMAEIEPIQEIMHKKTILFTGRLEKDNDPIKQYSIPLYAVSDLIKRNDATLEDIELKLYGLESEAKEELNKKIEDLKTRASKRADRVVPIKPLAYTANRDTLFSAVRNSSIAIMPSISEGFGLVGLESIAAGVPTIVSKNSGLFEFLENQNLNGYVEAINILGGIDSDAPNEADVQNIYNSLRNILKDYSKYKKRALDLRQRILDLGFTWDKTATEILDFLNVFEISNLTRRLIGLIDSGVQNQYFDVILPVAVKNVDAFAEQICNEFKLDKKNDFIIKS